MFLYVSQGTGNTRQIGRYLHVTWSPHSKLSTQNVIWNPTTQSTHFRGWNSLLEWECLGELAQSAFSSHWLWNGLWYSFRRISCMPRVSAGREDGETTLGKKNFGICDPWWEGLAKVSEDGQRAHILGFQNRRLIIATFNSAAITKATTDNSGLSRCAWVTMKQFAEAS